VPDQPPVRLDFVALIHFAIRGELWSALAPIADVESLRAQCAPYVDRVVIGGTGIAFAGFAAHALGLLARAAGDLDAAIGLFTTSMTSNAAAGFAPYADADAAELARTVAARDREVSGRRRSP
jgi:hypothetical protein